MFRRLFLPVAFLAVLSAPPLRALTAEELARHLGVQSWESTVDLPSGSFAIAYHEVLDGKMLPNKDGNGSFAGDPHDPAGSHLVLLVSHENGTMKLTALLGPVSETIGPSGLRDIPLPATSGLPAHLRAGIYILGGQWKPRKGVETATGGVAGLAQGLVLEIVPLK